MNRRLTLGAALGFALAASAGRATAQAELTAWGNLEGIRVQGQRFPVGGGLCVLDESGAEVARTAKSRQKPRYSREGTRQTVVTRLAELAAREVVEDTGPGAVTVRVRFSADSSTAAGAGHYCLDLPRAEYGGGTVQLIGATAGPESATLAAPRAGAEYLRGTARGIRFTSPRVRLELSFERPTQVLVRDAPRRGNDDIRVYLPVLAEGAQRGSAAEVSLAVRVSGEIDHTPITLALDTTRPGQAFDGVGGNFRLQHPASDPAVVAYNLANLRVAWGRVELPWRSWHPDERLDPVREAEAGHLDPRARAAMEMARTLGQRGIPLILSVWFPPDWAVIPPAEPQAQRPTRGSRLDPARMQGIYASLAGYLLHLKRSYGVEPALFSFNEPERGIDVLFTPEEHAAFIRGFGAYLASRGLRTRMLLGDNADTYRTEYIQPAMQDPGVRPYIGAVSFHSWGGWTEELLSFWAGAARELGVPLMIAEASTDAWAWTYPDVFREPAYALEEIDLYLRLLTLTQPRSILQWQLTTDYSLLAGGGAFGDHSELRPTQRFWNLRQLASTPAGARALPLTCGSAAVRCAAFGDAEQGAYAVHLLNDGAARPATLTGLPAGVRELRAYVTDARRGMQEVARIPVSEGAARFTLDAASFTTLLGAR